MHYSRTLRPPAFHIRFQLAAIPMLVVLAACSPPAADQVPATEAATETPWSISTEPWTPREVGLGTPVPVPPDDTVDRELEERSLAETQRWQALGGPPDFRFTDEREASGITFRNEVVDDIQRDLKPVHYDHGNAVATADVDGDGILDLYFVNQLGENELWRGVGDGRFENMSDRSGTQLGDRVSVAASFADIDNDGDADLYVTTVNMGNALFVNDGSGQFTDATETAGLAYRGHSSGAVFFDYNLDGWLDLFVTQVGVYTTSAQGAGGYFIGLLDAFSGHLYPEREEISRLYKNLGEGRFEDVTEAVGLIDNSWSGDATAVDFNGDRFPDLYVLDMQGHDEYWVNEGGERFVPAGAEIFPSTPWGAMGVKAFDYDNDRDLDLILTDMHSDMSHEVGFSEESAKSEMRWDEALLRSGGRSIYGNAFYDNDGSGRFTEVSDAIGTENFWPWGVSIADFDADGYQDVFVAASMSYPYRYMPNLVLMNLAGQRFVDAAFSLGVEPRRDGVTYIDWFDLDCGGADAVHTVCRDQTERVTVRGTLGTRSSVPLDIDQDGDIDLVTHEFGHYPQVLVSDLSARREVHRVEVSLEGTKSNRDGLGAVVQIFADERTYTIVNDGKSGYLAQSRMPLYFGLGDATAIDAIEVQWPSGLTSRVENPPIDRPVLIREDLVP